MCTNRRWWPIARIRRNGPRASRRLHGLNRREGVGNRDGAPRGQVSRRSAPWTGSVGDRREPARVAVALAVDRREELALDLLRDRPAAVGGDGPVVDLPDGAHLGGGPGEEGLVGEVQVGPDQVLLV